jgi:hypothetical protein
VEDCLYDPIHLNGAMSQRQVYLYLVDARFVNYNSGWELLSGSSKKMYLPHFNVCYLIMLLQWLTVKLRCALCCTAGTVVQERHLL